MIGHVDHGKTTLTEQLSGKWTDTHSEELKRGITIRLGYANFCIYQNKKTKVLSVKEDNDSELKRSISIVDAPGHESLMATMLSGSTLMDGAILLVAANERCPQPQTREHIMALQITGVKNVIIVQNKIDLVSNEQALKNYKEIKEFLKNTDYKDSPIIPISAQHNANIDILLEAIQKNIPTPERNTKASPLLYIARSFDINKPGATEDNFIGGVLGGSVKQGIFKIGDKIEIRPGRIVEERNQKVWKPLITKITGLRSGETSVKEVTPGGSVALLTQLDPSIVKSDSLTGNVCGVPGKLPPVWDTWKLNVNLLERVVGAKEDMEVEPIKMTEPLMLNVNTTATVGVVSELSKNKITMRLKLAVCASAGDRVTISRRIDNRFRLIGYGIIL